MESTVIGPPERTGIQDPLLPRGYLGLRWNSTNVTVASGATLAFNLTDSGTNGSKQILRPL